MSASVAMREDGRGLERGLPRLEMRAPALIAKQKQRMAVAQASAENLAQRITEHARTEAARMLADARKTAEEIIADAQCEAAARSAHAELGADQGIGDIALPTGARLSVQTIIEIIACRHGLLPSDVMGPARTRTVVQVRFAAIAAAYLARPDMSLPQLGRAFRRDHTSILHALRKTGVYKGGQQS